MLYEFSDFLSLSTILRWRNGKLCSSNLAWFVDHNRLDLASFHIANGGERRHVMCVGARSGSNPEPLGSEPSALTNCASCPLLTPWWLDNKILTSWLLDNSESVSILESPILLIQSFCPLMLVPTGNSILEVFGDTIGVNGRVETFEGIVGCAGKVRLIMMLPCCYCEMLQHIHIELLLCYSDESVLAGVDLQSHYVAHHVVVDLLMVADMQLVVRLTCN